MAFFNIFFSIFGWIFFFSIFEYLSSVGSKNRKLNCCGLHQNNSVFNATFGNKDDYITSVAFTQPSQYNGDRIAMTMTDTPSLKE